MLKFCLAGEYPADVNAIGGGVIYVVYLLAETFAERDDIEFHVVSPMRGIDGVRVVERPGMTIHYVGMPTRRIVPNMLAQGARLAPVFAAIGPDVVNSHHSTTTDGAVRAGCRVVHTIHGVARHELPYARGKQKIERMIQDYTINRAVGKADAVTAVSRYAAEQYASRAKRPISLVDNPVEDLFRDVPDMRDCHDILFVGRVDRLKNPFAIIKAMPKVLRKHERVILNICGGVNDARYMDAMERFIKKEEIGESVRFLGVVDRPRMAELLSRSTAMVLTSRQESSPVVIAQAMTAGRPVIASRVGGVPEMMEDGVTGFLIGPDDSETIAARLIELLDNPAKARQMGDAAREVAANRYERHKVADRILEICKVV